MNTRSIFYAVTLVLSLAGTPWLVFVSTSFPLYLNNQQDLYFHHEVLYSYLGLFLLSWMLAIALFMWLKGKSTKHILWGYYLLGPLFLVYAFVHKLSIASSVKGILVIMALGVFVWAIILLNRRDSMRQAIDFFALISFALIAVDIYGVATQHRPYQPNYSRINVTENSILDVELVGQQLPNVYHIIFDEYQTDMFSLTLTPEVREKLSGFVFFPETTTLFGRTGMSLPSIFTGRSYDYNSPQIDYQWDAFNSEKSILYWLKKVGYKTYAYLHPIYKFNQSLFDYISFHTENSQHQPDNLTSAFNNLWVYANLPSFVARRLIDPIDYDQLRNQNMLHHATPIMSVSSLRNIFKHERRLPPNNRYVFVHLILPHFPYVLKEDCSFDSEGKKTSPLEQSRCSTQLIIEFIALLKELDRFDSSLIVIQSDHGSRFALIDGKLQDVGSQGRYSEIWSKARSRALLLVKPAATMDRRQLIVSDAHATLMDIAPTMFNSLGLNSPLSFDGIDLMNPSVSDLKRERFYHFFDKKGPNEWTDKMERFKINGSRVVWESDILLSNNNASKKGRR